LKHITFSLNVDVNLIGLKRSTNNNHFYQCEHESKICYFPFYKFQNVLTKLMFFEKASFYPVTIVEYNKKYYILNIPILNPLLISQHAEDPVIFEDTSITWQNIIDIICNKPVNFSFSIKIYSAFSYVKKILSKNVNMVMIGEYEKNEKTLHIFLTPQIGSTFFTMCQLKFLPSCEPHKNLKDMYCNPHIPEGEPCSPLQGNIYNPELLNQDYCVCDHSDTQRFHAPTNKAFKCLGKNKF